MLPFELNVSKIYYFLFSLTTEMRKKTHKIVDQCNFPSPKARLILSTKKMKNLHQSSVTIPIQCQFWLMDWPVRIVLRTIPLSNIEEIFLSDIFPFFLCSKATIFRRNDYINLKKPRCIWKYFTWFCKILMKTSMWIIWFIWNKNIDVKWIFETFST